MVRVTRPALAALLLAVAAPLAAQQAAPSPAPGQPLRLAWVNSQVILANTPGRAEAESTFAREYAGMRAEVQRLQSQLDSAVQEYNRTSVVMTPQAKAAREEQLRQMQTRTQTRAQELDQQAQSREQELTAPIMQRVNSVIEGIRAEYNLAFVFDVAAQGGSVVTADRTLDITSLVIQRLQAAGAGAAVPPPLPADSGRPAAAPADTTRRAPAAAQPPPRVRRP